MPYFFLGHLSPASNMYRVKWPQYSVLARGINFGIHSLLRLHLSDICIMQITFYILYLFFTNITLCFYDDFFTFCCWILKRMALYCAAILSLNAFYELFSSHMTFAIYDTNIQAGSVLHLSLQIISFTNLNFWLNVKIPNCCCWNW